jgi:hypothetical protein
MVRSKFSVTFLRLTLTAAVLIATADREKIYARPRKTPLPQSPVSEQYEL